MSAAAAFATWLVCSAAYGQSAQVGTDLGDYQPGDTALISGSGWAGGETVDLLVECSCGCSDAISTAADANGAFADVPYAIEQEHLGATCTITATGQSSGQTASAVFTDNAVQAFVAPVGSTANITGTHYTQDNCAAGSQSSAPPPQTKLVGQDFVGFGSTGNADGNTANNRSISLTAPLTSNQGGTFLGWDRCTGNGNNMTCVAFSTSLTICAPESPGGSPTRYRATYTADATPPTITCPANITTECTSPAGATASFSASASDPGGIASLQCAPPSGSTFPIGRTTDTCTARDTAGNAGSCSFSVTVVDTTAPSITCPANVSAECTGSQQATVNPGNATASDVCSAATVSEPGSGAYPLGSTTVTHVAADASGNSATCTNVVSVVDTTAPAVTCPAPVSAECTGNNAATVDVAAVTASDVCHGALPTQDPDAASYPLGTITLPFSATDGSGNTGRCTTSVTVVDTTAPTITCPANIDAECVSDRQSGVLSSGAASAVDACNPVVTVSNPADARYGLGTTTLTHTANDGHGNSRDCTNTVTVADTTAPAISCPAPVTAECTGNQSATVDVGPGTALDACTGSVNTTDPAPASYGLGPNTVTLSASDEFGNSASCSTSVRVVDTTPPQVTCPAPVTEECTGNNSATVNVAGATATDECWGTATADDPDAASYPLGTSSLTLGARDGSGNTASCDTSVKVEDTRAPSIRCPANITAECETSDHKSAVLGSGAATGSDVCSPTVTITNPADARYPLGTTTLTHSADDNNGNSSACTNTVTVVDTTLPSITCPAPISVPFNGVPAADFAGGRASDTCGGVAVAGADVEAADTCPHHITRTYTATDDQRLQNTCTQVITVNNLFAADAIRWHQPLARNGAADDTDPSANRTVRYTFRAGQNVPVKVHADGCSAEVTSRSNVSGVTQVFSDVDCDGLLDSGELEVNVVFNGLGGPGGTMVKVAEDGHSVLRYNLDTSNMNNTLNRCYIVRVTVRDTTGEAKSEDALLRNVR